MVHSMTGYGRGESLSSVGQMTVEIRGVNQRFLEVIPHMPRVLQPLEDQLKKIVLGNIKRGKIDIFITFDEKCAGNPVIKVDKALGLAYYNSLTALADACGLAMPEDVRQVASFPGVISQEKSSLDMDILWEQAVLPALQGALSQLTAMRAAEGAHLAADMGQRMAAVSKAVQGIEAAADTVAESYRDRLKERIRTVLSQEDFGQVAVDEVRLATEVAIYADKCAIDEEITRLYSHMKQFESTLNGETGESVGRKLEFILQEMNREVNTIGSKTNSLIISELVIEIKSELEKVREQIQNIE